MLLGELWWAQSAGAIPGNPLRAFVSVAIAMFLDASGFHAGSFAPASSSRKVHPVYRLRKFTNIRHRTEYSFSMKMWNCRLTAAQTDDAHTVVVGISDK